MKTTILDTITPLTLIGGGVASEQDLTLSMALAPVCVAADSGAHLAMQAGMLPEKVVGDMDSISDEVKSQIPADRLHHIPEQNSTDFDKALRSVSAPVIIAVGFAGGRIDHELATLNTLVSRCDKSIVVLCEHDIVFVCPKHIHLSMAAGTRVSLFPLGAVQGRSIGLNWPIDGLRFEPAVQSGTSNFATGDLTLEMDAPNMLCILPREFIQPVVSVLESQPEHARWPARAG